MDKTSFRLPNEKELTTLYTSHFSPNENAVTSKKNHFEIYSAFENVTPIIISNNSYATRIVEENAKLE